MFTLIKNFLSRSIIYLRGGIWRGVLGAGEWGADRVNTLAATAATAAAAQREREGEVAGSGS